MVLLSSPEPYCIDSTEVTRDHYAAWLAGSPTTSTQDAWCTWNTDFTPTCSWPPTAVGGYPQTCVDWCDASAYCKAVGKRLCGKIGGGSNAYADYENPALSQWHHACTSGGQYAYPYGNTYDPQACNGYEKGLGTFAIAGSLSSCQSTVAGSTSMITSVFCAFARRLRCRT